MRKGKKKGWGCIAKCLFWGVAGLSLAAAYCIYAYYSVPDVAALKKTIPKTTAMQEWKEKKAAEKGKKPSRRQSFIPLSSVSPHLRAAVVAAEDANFWGHEGVDYGALKEAAKKDWKKHRLAMGGSTITMQLAKNLYLSPAKNPLRKVREYFIAIEIDRVLAKARILEIYLNVVEWGPGVWGAQAASRYYFGKGASDLTPPEACLLAVLLPNPVARNPYSNRGRSLVAKRDRLLKIFLRRGQITGAEFERYTSEPLALADGSRWP